MGPAEGGSHRENVRSLFSTKADGLGIGLSLCRSIIESPRGRIKAVNIYNGETAVAVRFTFTLPVEPSRSEAPWR
jgi:K+-sensing histidine kinase KdpD